MSEWAPWVSSIGTLVATATSLFLLRQGQQDRRTVREEARREQAALVTCWAGWNTDSPNATLGHPQIPAIFIRNSSKQAVYDAFVDYRSSDDGALVRIAFGPIPPGETVQRDLSEHPPHARGWEPASTVPRLFFQDAVGERWHRSHWGRLMKDPGALGDDFAQEPDSRFGW